MAKNAVKSIPITSLLVQELVSDYTPINPNGLPFACFALRLTNVSGTVIDLSFDGTTDNEVIAANKEIVLEFQSQSQPNNKVSIFPKGTIVYAASIQVGAGQLFLSGYYVE